MIIQKLLFLILTKNVFMYFYFETEVFLLSNGGQLAWCYFYLGKDEARCRNETRLSYIYLCQKRKEAKRRIILHVTIYANYFVVFIYNRSLIFCKEIWYIFWQHPTAIFCLCLDPFQVCHSFISNLFLFTNTPSNFPRNLSVTLSTSAQWLHCMIDS